MELRNALATKESPSEGQAQSGLEKAAPAQQEVKRIELITKSDCTQCIQAKRLLDLRKISYTVKQVGKDIDRRLVQETYPEARSFPIILVDSKYVGGYYQLESLLSIHDEGTPTVLGNLGNL